MMSMTVFLDSARYEDIEPVASIQKQMSITPNWAMGRVGSCLRLTLELDETLDLLVPVFLFVSTGGGTKTAGATGATKGM